MLTQGHVEKIRWKFIQKMKHNEDSFRSVCTNAHLEETKIIEIIIEMWLLGFRDEAKKSKLQSTQKLRSNSASTYFGEKFVEIMKKNNLANKNYSSLTFKWDQFFYF